MPDRSLTEGYCEIRLRMIYELTRLELWKGLSVNVSLLDSTPTSDRSQSNTVCRAVITELYNG